MVKVNVFITIESKNARKLAMAEHEFFRGGRYNENLVIMSTMSLIG
jgi:hypothetical protein